jgi:hypothetical protein
MGLSFLCTVMLPTWQYFSVESVNYFFKSESSIHLRFAIRGSISEGFKTTQSIYSVCVVTKWLFARTNKTMERLRKSCTPNKRDSVDSRAARSSRRQLAGDWGAQAQTEPPERSASINQPLEDINRMAAARCGRSTWLRTARPPGLGGEVSS